MAVSKNKQFVCTTFLIELHNYVMLFYFLVKCYVQQCMDGDSGWMCEKKGEGDVKEAADGVCKERRNTVFGKANMFIRDHGYATEEHMENLKKGKNACWSSKSEGGPNEDVLSCVCNKDLCNKKWKLPRGVK